MLSRRALLQAWPLLPAPRAVAAAPQKPLRDIAAQRNICFGSAITCAELAADPRYAALIRRECAIVTPGVEAKWGFVEPLANRFHFAPMDTLAEFAQAAGLRLHMHNLIWAVGLPAWTLQALRAGQGAEILQRHIAAVAGRYRGRSWAWDVINEPIDPRWPADRDGICTTQWRRYLGADFIRLALDATARADPAARLMINDDDLEYDAPDREQKRQSYLRLIEKLLRQGARLHGFGLEAHLKPWLPIAESQYRRFLAELAGFGLELYITEFDVNDRLMPADIGARDTAIAAAARRYLDLALDEPAVTTLITWGLSDRTTWLARDPAGMRADGLAPRPLPFDADLAPKRLYAAIAQSLAAARQRPRL